MCFLFCFLYKYKSQNLLNFKKALRSLKKKNVGIDLLVAFSKKNIPIIDRNWWICQRMRYWWTDVNWRHVSLKFKNNIKCRSKYILFYAENNDFRVIINKSLNINKVNEGNAEAMKHNLNFACFPILTYKYRSSASPSLGSWQNLSVGFNFSTLLFKSLCCCCAYELQLVLSFKL